MKPHVNYGSALKGPSSKVNEQPRLSPFLREGIIEAGCDEAGRGCLAGPVFAAAVILPADFRSPTLNDSKKLTARQRDELRIEIEETALAWAVAMVTNTEIDSINILNASFLAMELAVSRLKLVPGHLIIDGNRFRSHMKIPFTCIVKGDGKYASIAAASVLAKTHRDEYMMEIHKDYPGFGWDQNKGYPTAAHREAIRKWGISPHHRKSFRLLDEQIELRFDQND